MGIRLLLVRIRGDPSNSSPHCHDRIHLIISYIILAYSYIILFFRQLVMYPCSQFPMSAIQTAPGDPGDRLLTSLKSGDLSGVEMSELSEANACIVSGKRHPAAAREPHRPFAKHKVWHLWMFIPKKIVIVMSTRMCIPLDLNILSISGLYGEKPWFFLTTDPGMHPQIPFW